MADAWVGYSEVVISHRDDLGRLKTTVVTDIPQVVTAGRRSYYIDLRNGAVAPPPEPYKSYKCSWDASSEFGVVPLPPEGFDLDSLSWLTDEQRDHIRQRWASDSECRNLALGDLRRRRAQLAHSITNFDEPAVAMAREELKRAAKALEDSQKKLAGLDAIIAEAG